MPAARPVWPRHRVRAWRVLIALCAVAVLLTDVWRCAHLLTTSHVACPYDGIATHADHDGPPVTHEQRDRPPRGKAPVSVVPRHHHAECCAPDASNRPMAAPSLARPVTASVEWLVQVERVSSTSNASRCVLDYAPKLPPPSV